MKSDSRYHEYKTMKIDDKYVTLNKYDNKYYIEYKWKLGFFLKQIPSYKIANAIIEKYGKYPAISASFYNHYNI